MVRLKDEQAVELFVAALREEGRSENTIKNYVADIKHAAKFVGGTRGDGVSSKPQKAFKEYTQQIQKSGLAISTVNRRIQSLKTFFNVLQAKGLCNDNPMDGIKPIKVAKQNETKWLERHQVKAIFEAIDKLPQGEDKRLRDRAIIAVLVNCGLRVQELCDLKMDDLDWKHGLISVVGKGGKFRKVPFNSATQKAVKRWFQYRDINTPYVFHTERSPQMTPRAVQHLTKKLSDNYLNFTFTVHQLRHTALKNIADTTGKIEIVATVAGHENVNTSKRYIEPSLQEISEAMQKNEFDF